MPHLAKCILRYDEDDYINAPNRSYTVGSANMPALEYLEGVTHFDATLLSLPLYHIQLVADHFTFPCEWETPMPLLLSVVIEGTEKNGTVEYLDRFPEWFGGEIFPKLQELHVWHLDEMAYIPASFRSFIALTELSLFEVGFNNMGQYERETQEAVLCVSLCAEAMPLKSKAFRRQRTARLAGEKCADITALAENAINVSEFVSVRVGVCERECA